MGNIQATFNVGFFLKTDRSVEKTGIRNLYALSRGQTLLPNYLKVYQLKYLRKTVSYCQPNNTSSLLKNLCLKRSRYSNHLVLYGQFFRRPQRPQLIFSYL